MNRIELEDVLDALRIEKNDNRQYEVKAAQSGFPKSIAKTICAFANMPGGGTIILGVDEKREFAITGVSDVKNCQHTLAHYAQREYSVPILVDISTVIIDEKSAVLARVHEVREHLKPVRYKKTGTSFIRQYDSDFELSRLEEKLFESNQGIVHYDEDPVSGSSIADLNKALLDGYINNRKRSSDVLRRIGDDEVLLRTGVIHHSGEVSTAGILALGVYPQQFFPNYTLKACVRKKDDLSAGIRASNVRSFDGPVPEMLESALRWITANSKEFTTDLADGNVANINEYPLITCREMIANSLIHRDLCPMALIETITLTIEDERLIISNPGGLFGLSINELGKTASRTRNTRLAELSQFVPAERGANVIEKLGSGIPKMYSEQDRHEFPRPSFIDGEIYFTAILRRGSLTDAMNGLPKRFTNTARILKALSRKPLSRVEIEKETNLTTAQVRYALTKLIREQQVGRIGKDKDPNNTYFAVNEE